MKPLKHKIVNGYSFIVIDDEIFKILSDEHIKYQGGDGANDVDTIENYINYNCPYNIDKVYYFQEEFWIISNRGFNPELVKDKIIYKSDKKHGSKRTTWFGADMMQEHQARHKYRCVSIEVVRANEAPISGIELLSIVGNDLERNPYGFLIKWERGISLK